MHPLKKFGRLVLDGATRVTGIHTGTSGTGEVPNLNEADFSTRAGAYGRQERESNEAPNTQSFPTPPAITSQLSIEVQIAILMTHSARVQQIASRQLRNIWRGLRVSERALYIIRLVYNGIDRPAGLAAHLDTLPNAITLEADKLVETGLLIRGRDASDRRAVRLQLTKAGLAVHANTTDAIEANLRPRLERLTDQEREHFFRLFARILA